jgi:hypothetical protein
MFGRIDLEELEDFRKCAELPEVCPNATCREKLEYKMNGDIVCPNCGTFDWGYDHE